MDPRDATSTVTAGVLAHMFNKLVRSDENMQIEPDLAESYEQIDDLTWRFHLRKDVIFHDGSKFTAKDVEYTLATIKDPEKKYKLATDFSFMTASVVDDYTVDISTAEPYPGLLLRLNYVMIIPMDYVEKVGNEEFAKNPVGSGPYKFVERIKDEKAVLEVYDGYFRGKSAISKITYRIMPESAARIAALEAGDVDFCSAIPASEAKRLSAKNDLAVVGNPTSRVTFVCFNSLVEGPLQNVKVRQALNYAVDKKTLIDGVLDGLATQVSSLSCPEYVGYDASIAPYGYDVEKAKGLLAEAGYADGFTLQASYTASAANSADVMQYIREMEYLPRSEGGAAHFDPGGGDVSGQDRGACRQEKLVCEPCASLYPGAALGGAHRRSRPGEKPDHAVGRHSQPHPCSAGLQLFQPLSHGARAVPKGGSGIARNQAGTFLPLPAGAAGQCGRPF
jgi:peptide/nickel transport system substrate-binding protein